MKQASRRRRRSRQVRAIAAVAAMVLAANGGVLVPAWGATDAVQAGEAELSSKPVDYVIGREDTLKVTVFEVPSLSFDPLQVDAAGEIEMPLIGKIKAAGLTATQLQDEIARLLGAKYLQNPQVAVAVENASSEKVAIEGDVKLPGVYKLLGDTTLMQAIAMGGGVSETADLKKVEIVREVNGQQQTLVYNYAAVQKGRAPDPIVHGNDVVVVGSSTMRTVMSDVLKSGGLMAALAVLVK